MSANVIVYAGRWLSACGKSRRDAAMSALELKVPPLILLLLAGLAMWALAGTPTTLPAPVRVVSAVALLVSGVAIAVAGVLAFRCAQTTVSPTHPERAGHVVTAGIYRWTRNPMYVGMTLVLLAWALWLGQSVPLLVLPAFVVWLTRWQIVPEERALAARFGDAYLAYSRQVRRWI